MHLGLVGFCSFSEEGVRKERKEARFLSSKNQINKRKTASNEAVPLPGDKSGDAGGVDRARTYDLHDVKALRKPARGGLPTPK